jgi:hypothetical protein
MIRSLNVSQWPEVVSSHRVKFTPHECLPE